MALLLIVLLPALPASASGDVTPPNPFDFVADSGDYQTGYGVASPYNNIYVTWQVTSDDQSAVSYEVTVDGVLDRVVTDTYGWLTVTKRVEVPDGSHVVGVTAVDASGNRQDATHSLDVVIDKIDPWFTTKPQLLLRTGPVTSAGYPMRYTWTGTDEGTGLVAARIGPNQECCYTMSPTRKRFDFTVPPQSPTVWRLWLVDGVGRLVKTPRSGYVDPAPWSSTKHSDRWHKVDDSTALDGSEWVSTHPGDRFSITATGESIGWVTSTGPHRGRADVMVGNKVVDTVSLHSRHRRAAQVVWTARLSGRKATKVTIVNRSSGSRDTIGVDALLLHTSSL
jgi:hypothetical protein